MLLFVPYSADIKWVKIPVLSFLIVVICFTVFYFQYQNETQFKAQASQFCHQIGSHKKLDEMDKMVSDHYLCTLMLQRLEERPDLEIKAILAQYFWFHDLSVLQRSKMSSFIEQHYSAYSKNNIALLNKDLMYFPQSLNPIKMLTSAFAHADLWHLLGNIIFFLAFAPALEVLLKGSLLFLVSGLIIILTTSITYSVSVLFVDQALPTLGLSGLVMGMIGMFSALIPAVRIKVFVWILLYIRKISIPAWVLALWYIGGDSLALILSTADPSVNLVAHVSGALTGYGLGYFWLRKHSILPQ